MGGGGVGGAGEGPWEGGGELPPGVADDFHQQLAHVIVRLHGRHRGRGGRALALRPVGRRRRALHALARDRRVLSRGRAAPTIGGGGGREEGDHPRDQALVVQPLGRTGKSLLLESGHLE